MNPACTIRHPENCSSLEEAVQKLMHELEATKDVYYQGHRLSAHQGFPIHRHFTTNEWIVLHNAECDFVTRQETVNINALDKPVIVHVPSGVCHTVRSRAAGLRYAVVKDGPDDFNPC